MIRPRTMPGVLELLPLEQITFQRMLDTIREVFQRFGFIPIETPALELAEVLLTKTGGETERQVYFAQSTGSREQGAEPDLALRFDLTVPLARYVAEHEQQLTFPFRRYQIQRVYRGESAQRGRFREFYQSDIDVIGRDELSLAHDAELPAVIHEVFTRLGIGPFTIRINNRRVMRGVLDLLGVVDPALQESVLREVDKIDKRGVEAVKGTLIDMKVGRSAAKRLMEILGTKTPTLAEAYAVLDGFPPGHPELERGIAEIRGVLGLVGEMGVPEERFCLDLSIARGLDYYTGTVYETTLDQHPEIGSICSGGRYDGLAGHYTTSTLPGVGISIGLTRLFWQLREAGLIGEPESTVKVLVTLMDAEGLTYALDVGRRLREKGVNTEVTLEPSKLGKQLKQASKSGIRYAVIAGENERAKGTVTVKDLVAQTQKELAVKAAVKELSQQE